MCVCVGGGGRVCVCVCNLRDRGGDNACARVCVLCFVMDYMLCFEEIDRKII